MPLTFTKNPKTGEVDYINPNPDLISMSYHEQIKEINFTLINSNKEDYQLLLPVYINKEHFTRALPYIQQVMIQLAPNNWKGGFHPSLILHVIPIIFNTLTVLLSDGVTASEFILNSYCLIHHLFLMLAEAYPEIETYATEQLTKFISDPRNRVKEVFPSLGKFMSLIMITNDIKWIDLISAYQSEKTDIDVLWICRAFPELQYTEGVKAVGIWERLEKSFEGNKVSNKITMLMASFVRMIGKPNDNPISNVANMASMTYGLPNYIQVKEFQTIVKEIQNCKSWTDYCRIAGLSCPSPNQLANILTDAISKSITKGYHKAGMDFSQVHKSGVSKILLKGDSYSVQPNVKQIRMEDVWCTIKVANGTNSQQNQAFGEGLFLDASLLLYDNNKNFVSYVDYSNTRFQGIRHSGDIIDLERNEGKHTIDINLVKLPKDIKDIFFVISTWRGPKLCEVKQPFIRLCDPGTDDMQELCRYTQQHDNIDKTATSLIMCHLYRTAPGVNQWKAVAIGTLGKGCVSEYDPINEMCSKVLN